MRERGEGGELKGKQKSNAGQDILMNATSSEHRSGGRFVSA